MSGRWADDTDSDVDEVRTACFAVALAVANSIVFCVAVFVADVASVKWSRSVGCLYVCMMYVCMHIAGVWRRKSAVSPFAVLRQSVHYGNRRTWG